MMNPELRKKLHTTFEEYGKLFVEYYGEGEITYENSIKYKCHFGIVQLFEGDIYFAVNIEETGFTFNPKEPDKKFDFRGMTEDGRIITFHTDGVMNAAFSFLL
jgi:hypothetical protein